MPNSEPRWAVAETPNPFEHTISVRQIVAHNLAWARKERGMTQGELGERLRELTGKEWSRATVSAAESGWDSRAQNQRIRHFDANEVAAFALALRVPLSWFFLPPSQLPTGDPLAPDEARVTVATNDFMTHKKVITSGLLQWLALSVGDPDDPDDLMSRRLNRQGWGGAQDPMAGTGEMLRQVMERLDQLHLRLDAMEQSQ